MNRFIILALSFLLFISCTVGLKKQSEFNETVTLDDTKGKIELNSDSSAKDTYGPSLEEGKVQEVEQKKRVGVLTLDLVPSLYASLSYINLFKELERKKIYPNIISANGFSLIIATLYARYKNSNKLEWKVFALLRNLKGINVHTSKWYEAIEVFLSNEFKSQRIEQLKILIASPRPDPSDEITTTGLVTNIVMKSLRLAGRESFINRPHYNYRNALFNLGTDNYFLINAIPDKFNFKIPNGFAWGLYTRVSGVYSLSDTESLKITNSLKFIDTLPNLSDLLISSRSDVEKLVDIISQQQTDWINKNN